MQPIQQTHTNVKLAAVVMGLVMVVACSSSQPVEVDRPANVSSFDPELRAARIETSGCEFASGRTGSGVAVENGLVITVAHLVARAADLEVSIDDVVAKDAVVAAVDLERDLAVIRVPTVKVPDVVTSAVTKGEHGQIVGSAGSGTVSFEVKAVVDLTIEEILGTDRHSRMGYELAASTADGDSGAGVYDDADQLIGIVFATSQDGTSTWVTAVSEIESFLSKVDQSATYAACEAG